MKRIKAEVTATPEQATANQQSQEGQAQPEQRSRRQGGIWDAVAADQQSQVDQQAQSAKEGSKLNRSGGVVGRPLRAKHPLPPSIEDVDRRIGGSNISDRLDQAPPLAPPNQAGTSGARLEGNNPIHNRFQPRGGATRMVGPNNPPPLPPRSAASLGNLAQMSNISKSVPNLSVIVPAPPESETMGHENTLGSIPATWRGNNYVPDPTENRAGQRSNTGAANAQAAPRRDQLPPRRDQLPPRNQAGTSGAGARLRNQLDTIMPTPSAAEVGAGEPHLGRVPRPPEREHIHGRLPAFSLDNPLERAIPNDYARNPTGNPAELRSNTGVANNARAASSPRAGQTGNPAADPLQMMATSMVTSIRPTQSTQAAGQSAQRMNQSKPEVKPATGPKLKR